MIPGLEKATAGAVSLRLRHVLIVDDALPVRRKLIEILHRSGLSATEMSQAESAEHALEIFAMQNPTLIFAEFVGEGSAGLEMVLEMLHIDPQAKVVLVTADDPASPMVRAAIRAGVFGVVQKPLRHEAIRQILAEIESEEGGIERYR
ncbi:MAG TPA: response regulator [Candidatus Thermoplasmatota archaeon]|nr:response regulator [Candidatus Thermoplasmatota archaeon]